ncbi:hypothetical protein BDF20DRAFT_837927 [Mycotypha africana]|uniref:uncharacterized protein n=1 Tax=Mycotypha africana TaxID=64632 RepID=UPI0022FFF04B|nr:uncharacterized protein BDF20DRAFT_837927 [Mycotypha africana]KAI8971626.1 hypothetical protein BDF20DRAFT_837927 [Mycotypha africana]
MLFFPPLFRVYFLLTPIPVYAFVFLNIPVVMLLTLKRTTLMNSIRLKRRRRQNQGILYLARHVSYNVSAEVRVKGTFTQIYSLTSFHRSNRSRHRYSMMSRAVTIGKRKDGDNCSGAMSISH